MAKHKATAPQKYCRNLLSLVRKYDTFTPCSSKFFSFRLYASISEAFSDRTKITCQIIQLMLIKSYEVNPYEFRNLHHRCHCVLQHHSDLLEEVVVQKQVALKFHLNEAFFL